MTKRNFRSVRGAEGLAQIADAWEQLTSRNPDTRYCHLHAWMQAYLDCLEDDPDTVLFVLATRGDRLEAIFPLRMKRGGVPVLEVPRHPHMNLQDIVLDPSADCSGLLSELLAYLDSQQDLKYAAVQFGKVIDDSAVLKLINAL